MTDGEDFDPVALQFANAGSQVEHLLSLGQVDRARQLAMDVLAREPDSPQGLLLLIQVLLYEGHFEAALEPVEQLLGRWADLDVAHSLHATALEGLGRFAESELAILRAIQLSPSDADWLAQYATLLSICDADYEAMQAIEEAVRLEPDVPYLHRQRAHLLQFLHPGKWSIREQAARTAVALDPGSPDAHAILGMIQLQQNQREAAEDSFRTALQIHPHNPMALRGLSEVVKARYFWYRPMLAYGQLLSRFGRDGQLGIVFGLWALYGATSAVTPPQYREFLMLAYLGACLYTWMAEPITRAILRRTYPWLS